MRGLATAFGVTWSICMLFAGLASMFGWCTKFIEVMSSIYIGLKPTFLGSIIGVVWGLSDGVVGGLLIALIYNAVVKKNNS